MAISQKEAKERFKAKNRLLWQSQDNYFLSTNFRVCSKCGISKSLSNFCKSASALLGRDPRCSECRSSDSHKRYWRDPKTSREYQRKIQERHRSTKRIYRVESYARKRFGLSARELEEFVQAYISANGPKCFSCGIECQVVGGVKKKGLRRLVVDHDHESGNLRSMICDFCNTALGKLGDNSDGVKKLLSYIERYEK